MKDSFISPSVFEQALQFRSRTTAVALPTSSGLEALRIAWLGVPSEVPSLSRFIAIAWTEKDFESCCLAACSLQTGKTFPWLHGPSAFSSLVFSAVCRHLNPDCYDEINPHQTSAPANAFSASRASNYFCFYQMMDPHSLEVAAQSLCSHIPAAFVFDQHGFDFQPEPERFLSATPTLFSLHHDYFDSPHFRETHPGFEPLIQVDDEGQIHWLSITAAARALGAPAPISTSLTGIGRLLAHGDILAAANRLASHDAPTFRWFFKDALYPYDAAQIECSKQEASRTFIAADRRAALQANTSVPSMISKPHRL